MNDPANASSPAPPSNPTIAPQQTATETFHKTEALQTIKPTSTKKARNARPSISDLLPHAALELRSSSTGLIIAAPFTAAIYRDASGRAANGRDIAYSVAYYARVHGTYPIEYLDGFALPDGWLDFTAQLPEEVQERKLGGLRSEGSANLEGMKGGDEQEVEGSGGWEGAGWGVGLAGNLGDM